ncbi:unnamed protein product [Lactuca virosa]|uniref:Uncharacterized protein n=1 Tax=Lactuca virosa TaxID=75947 RepID=A0AAU9M9P1_9ASTR|nr:unnamed protein product [Lactuca virosa]
MQKNEALSIRVEIMERKLLENDKMLIDTKEFAAKLEFHLNWVVNEGVVRVVDKVIELLEFIHGISLIKNICWDVGEESSLESVKREVVVRTFDIGAASSSLSHAGKVTDSIYAFVSCDYATLLHLGELDVDDLKELCIYEDRADGGINGVAKITGLDGDDRKGGSFVA